MKVAVLGAGMVGRAMAVDLSKKHVVVSFDINESNLTILSQRDKGIETRQADLVNYSSYTALLAEFDIVITAVPGSIGYKTLKAVINAGKNVVDISFFPEDVLLLDEIAKKKGVTAITDCGVAPGLSNFIIGYHNEEMRIDNLEIYVGGLPKIPKKPFHYKAPFSPADVIEEYIRPARLMENGHIVVKPALSERETMEFDKVGTLEAFNTDGLRSLLYTMPHIKNQKEKTLRYPGHIDLIIALKESGFFDDRPMSIEGNQISPLKFSSQILFNEWRLGAEEEELTLMKIILEGEQQGKKKRLEYNLLDRYDPLTKTSSMARTTGYTCAAAANLVLKGLFTEKGVFPPELVGKHKDCFEFVVKYLGERNVKWEKIEE